MMGKELSFFTCARQPCMHAMQGLAAFATALAGYSATHLQLLRQRGG